MLKIALENSLFFHATFFICVKFRQSLYQFLNTEHNIWPKTEQLNYFVLSCSTVHVSSSWL